VGRWVGDVFREGFGAPPLKVNMNSYRKEQFGRKVSVTIFAMEQGIRAASRLFKCKRKTARKWVKEYYDYLNNALFSDNWIKDYYGRTAREACLLTKEQRMEHCNEKECESWKYCRMKKLYIKQG